MNIHIELVKKWLADPSSVTQEELKVNAEAAKDAFWAAYKAAACAAEYLAVHKAALWAAYKAADDAAYWVKRYEELTK